MILFGLFDVFNLAFQFEQFVPKYPKLNIAYIYKNNLVFYK